MKREESRGFDVCVCVCVCFFFFFFFLRICVFGRKDKKLKKCPGKEQKHRKVVSSSGLKVSRAFYSPNAFFEAAALQGLPPSKGLRSG